MNVFLQARRRDGAALRLSPSRVLYARARHHLLADVQLLTWGFLQTYLVRAGALAAPGGAAQAAGTLIGAILLWDILLRGQQGFCFSFIEEMWSRNLPNILMSPLRPAEFVAALVAMSLIRLVCRRASGDDHGDHILRLQSLGARPRLRRLLRRADALRLEHRSLRLGHFAALRTGRGESRLVADVLRAAARRRLLSSDDAAHLAAADLLDAAADLCVRRSARRADRSCRPLGSPGAGSSRSTFFSSRSPPPLSAYC